MLNRILRTQDDHDAVAQAGERARPPALVSVLNAGEISLVIEIDSGPLLPTVVTDHEAFAIDDCWPYLFIGKRVIAAVTDVETHRHNSFRLLSSLT